MARKSAEFADEYIKGKRDFPQKVPVPVEIVTQENVGKYGDYGKKYSAMRAVRWIIAIVAATGVCWLFPLFHIVTLKTATEERVAATFNAPRNSRKLSGRTNCWRRLEKKTVKAGSKSFPADSKRRGGAAKKKFSRSVGLSEGYFYFISGSGRIVAVSDDEISLAVTDGSTNAEVSLQTGLIFGNALRDAAGLAERKR